MELPFAVESESSATNSALQHSDSSLVTASSQGSFMNSSDVLDREPLPPNTPQDVVLPHYDHVARPGTQSARPSLQSNAGHLVTPAQDSQVDDFGEPEIIDFTYVNISEAEADEVDVAGMPFSSQRGDILSLLLGGSKQNHNNDLLLNQTEDANDASRLALEAKRNGDLVLAFEKHTKAANLFRENAMAVKERNVALANSLLLLSQTQAKSALALKEVVKSNPAALHRIFPPTKGSKSALTTPAEMSHKDRLRAVVRGALGSRHPHEEDISESQFLGTASSEPPKTDATELTDASRRDTIDSTGENSGEGVTLLTGSQDSSQNPVDEIMSLERELRDMDMAIELGSSISSLDARMHSRMKASGIDGSFMVVPPGSNSYMVSSAMWGSGYVTSNSRPSQANKTGAAGVRARANRVQNMLEASSTPANRHAHAPHIITPAPASKANPGLESSWWGGAGTVSQVLSSSAISLGSRAGMEPGMGEYQGSIQPANTKQLMRLMDSLKTLGDENATLLREVEEAEAARMEAKQAREEMKRFKVEYGKRFMALKKALEKFRQDHPKGGANDDENPVNTSDYIRSASVTEQLQRQEQLIRKLTADFKKEKEESKKKDAALRKYESFYREVKARSAQKAAMKTQQQRLHMAPRHASSPSEVHR